METPQQRLAKLFPLKVLLVAAVIFVELTLLNSMAEDRLKVQSRNVPEEAVTMALRLYWQKNGTYPSSPDADFISLLRLSAGDRPIPPDSDWLIFRAASSEFDAAQNTGRMMPSQLIYCITKRKDRSPSYLLFRSHYDGRVMSIHRGLEGIDMKLPKNMAFTSDM